MTPRNLIAFALLISAFGQPVFAADLVNINTADSATLQTLNGIGPSKAQGIIDYRTQHGPFATIADIQNVSGIGPTTYANIQNFITVGDATTQTQTTDQTQSQTQSTTTAQPQAQTQTSGGNGPPPITAQITTDSTAVVGAGTYFSGAAFSQSGEPLSGARYIWNFGDGATAEGRQVWHTYAYPGAYEAVLSVAYNFSSASARIAVSALPASMTLVAEGDGSLTIANQSAYDLDIGLWSLTEGTKTFVIPEGTMLLRSKGVRFSPAVLKFNGDESARLYYQNGSLAATAATGAHSPLRGETVELAAAQNPLQKSSDLPSIAASSGSVAGQTSAQNSASAPTSSAPTLNSSNQAAAAGMAPLGIEWSYLLGLTALIAIGAVGTYYAYEPRRSAETPDPADEFDIEE